MFLEQPWLPESSTGLVVSARLALTILDTLVLLVCCMVLHTSQYCTQMLINANIERKCGRNATHMRAYCGNEYDAHGTTMQALHNYFELVMTCKVSNCFSILENMSTYCSPNSVYIVGFLAVLLRGWLIYPVSPGLVTDLSLCR